MNRLWAAMTLDRRPLDADGAVARIHRTLVQVSTAAAAVFLIAVTVPALFLGDYGSLVRAVPPALVTLTGVLMLAAGRPHAGLHLAVGMVGLIFTVSVDESAVPGDPLLGLLAMGIVGTALVGRMVWLYMVGTGMLIGAAGYLWQPVTESVLDRLANASAAVMTFAITGLLLHWLRTQSLTHRRRLERLVAAKDEFVAAISHELRTPMTTIVGLSAELCDRLGEFSEEETGELLALVRRESEDVAHIVEDLLVMGQDGVGALQLDCRPISIADELTGALATSPNVRLTTEPHGGLDVFADAGRTRQIVRNLVVNARRYGGAEVRVVLRKTVDAAVIEVRDTGAPIPAEERELMFLPYHRSPATRGTPGSVGLGLTVSRRLARLMDGDIDYHHDGVESVFTFSLPLHGGEARPALTAVA